MSIYKKEYVYSMLSVIILLQLSIIPVCALDVVPRLKGFGTDTRAAYGARFPPEICIVDNLTTRTGDPSWTTTDYSVGVFKGSLNQCMEGLDTLDGETIDGHVVAANSGKIVLFEVSGTIKQEGTDGDSSDFIYKVENYTTIAGQTSPEPGILLRNISLSISGYHDILIQHIRGRMDGPPSTISSLSKPFMVATGATRGSAYNIVFDHNSGAWGRDAQIDLWHGGPGDMENITISNCLFGESREGMGLIGDEGTHNSQNSIMGAHVPGGAGDLKNIAVLNNMYTNGKRRNPKLANGEGVLVNNYSYNNRDSALNLDGVDRHVTYVAVNNVVDGGPMSLSFASNKITSFGFAEYETPFRSHQIYLYGNQTDAGTQTSSSDWSMVDNRLAFNADLNTDAKVTGENPATDAPLWPTGLTYVAASALKASILANVGAYPAFRDSLDQRFLDDMENGTGPSRVQTGPPPSGDWPTLAENTITLAIPSDPHGDADSDGYTNLEEWLHVQAEIVEGKTMKISSPSDFRKM